MMVNSAVVRIVGRLTFMHVQVVSISLNMCISLDSVEGLMGIWI